jgi:Tfp pilus assembly PilM family ATPase
MSNFTTDMGTRRSAIAIAQDGARLKAVKLSKQGPTCDILWTKRTEAGDLDWKAFELECGLAAETVGQEKNGGGKTVVAGFDSAGVVFYCIDLPTAGEEELETMVKIQAEARLPLPAEQMELAWRADQARNGKLPVTIAAARKEPLQRFIENVRGFEPEKILLDCEGIVKAWRTLFSGDGRDAVVVSITERKTQVCLAKNGRLSNAVVLDTGTEDLSVTNQDPFAFVSGRPTDRTESAEMFIQDIRSVLELFGYAEPADLPIFVLSDNSNSHEAIVTCLKSAGLNVKVAYPETAKLDSRTTLSSDDIYEYRVPIGLALTALDGDAGQLDIFERLYIPAGAEKRKFSLYSPIVSYSIAAVSLVLLLIIFAAVDITGPDMIKKRLGGTGRGTTIHQLGERLKLIKSLESKRPDLLTLLNQINEGGSQGILLDKFEFKSGRPASITGQAQRTEQLYEFQKNLLAKKGITDVKIQSATPDNKTKKIKFTMTFHYSKFTKKK